MDNHMWLLPAWLIGAPLVGAIIDLMKTRRELARTPMQQRA